MKNLNTMKPLGVREDSLVNLLHLYEFRGMNKYYDEHFKSDQNKLIKDNVKKELFYFAEFFDLNITDARKKVLYKKDCLAKNKDEQIYMNFKEIITRLLADPDGFELETYQFLELAEALFKGVEKINFRTYKVDVDDESLISKSRLVSMRSELESMLFEFKDKYKHGAYEVTNLITNFYIDYKNQEIFTKYNEQLGIIYFYFLLLKCKFTVFKYVTFFDKMIKHKEEFKDAVLKALVHYEEGYSDTVKLNNLIIDILLESYEELKAYFNSYSFEYKNTKEDLIVGVILKLPQEFTKEDIKKAEPLVSESTINRALKTLSDNNKIRALGTGRSAKWMKIEKDIDPFNSRQIDIFNIEE